MAIRRIQDLLRPDPAYAGTFEAKDDANPPPLAEPRRPTSGPRMEPVGSEPAEPAPVPPVPEPPSARADDAPASEPAVRAAPVASAARTARKAAPSAQVAPAPPPAPRGRVPVSVRIRPSVEQAARIAATGLRGRDVLQAAWRKAAAGYAVGPDYVEPEDVARAGGPSGLFDTTLMVDAEPLEALARVHDPLSVKGAWWLIRGQMEPRFWTAVDEVLARISERK